MTNKLKIAGYTVYVFDANHDGKQYGYVNIPSGERSYDVRKKLQDAGLTASIQGTRISVGIPANYSNESCTHRKQSRLHVKVHESDQTEFKDEVDRLNTVLEKINKYASEMNSKIHDYSWEDLKYLTKVCDNLELAYVYINPWDN